MKTLLSSGLLVMSTTAMAYAQDVKPVAVPEISALEGTAAIAAIAAIVALVWERRRRAS